MRSIGVALICKVLWFCLLDICLYYIAFIMLSNDILISRHSMPFMMKTCWILLKILFDI